MSVSYGQKTVTSKNLVLYADPGSSKNYTLSEVEVLVVAGGGGGGSWHGGAGGGGGVLYSSNYKVTPGTAISVTVGGGGARGGNTNAGTTPNGGGDGGNSIFGTLTAIGGGGGGSYSNNGRAGGSGGAPNNWGVQGVGGSGVAGPPRQGYSAVQNDGSNNFGGGGAGAGSPPRGPAMNSGGNGLPFTISGQLRYYGGGGGAGIYPGYTNDTCFGTGGLGGGGNGGNGPHGSGTEPVAGVPNTGGGGGGVADLFKLGGAGGSGVVIVRYPGPQKATGGDTITQVDGYTIHTFTTVSTTTFIPNSFPNNNSAILGLTNLSNESQNTNIFYGENGGPLYNTSAGGCLTYNNSYYFLSIRNTLFESGNYLYSDPNYGPWTVSAWFNFPSSPATLRDNSVNGGNASYSIVGRSGGIGGGATFDIFVSGSETTFTPLTYYLYVVIRGTITQISSSAVNTNTWNNVVVTWNGSNNFAYLNGSNPISVTTGVAALQLYSLQIGSTAQENGALGAWVAHAFDGRIGPVAIYNKALTTSEVQQNFNALRGRFGI